MPARLYNRIGASRDIKRLHKAIMCNYSGVYTNTMKIIVLGLVILIFGGFAGYMLLSKPSNENLLPPGKERNSAKKVEDYFIEHLRMSADEAYSIRKKPGVDGKVNLRLNTNVTLGGLIGNLSYYGFIRDEKVFLYALEATQDTTPSEKAIKVGKNGTIDQNAEYRISEDMSAWELADTLLNKPASHFPYDEYNYFFMP